MDSKKTGLIIGIVGILVLVILVGVFIAPTDKFQPSTQVQISPTTAVVTSNKKHTYQDFLSSGKSEICTFLIYNSGQPILGTVYAGNGKIRTDFTLTGTSGTFQQHLVIDSYVAYMWTNLNNSGVKFIVEPKSEDELSASRPNFDCKSWTPNLSVFEIPANIVFTEIADVPVPVLNPQ